MAVTAQVVTDTRASVRQLRLGLLGIEESMIATYLIRGRETWTTLVAQTTLK